MLTTGSSKVSTSRRKLLYLETEGLLCTWCRKSEDCHRSRSGRSGSARLPFNRRRDLLGRQKLNLISRVARLHKQKQATGATKISP